MGKKADKTPFKVGDKVKRRYPQPGQENEVLTVRWVCKGNYDRTEQLIATEFNGYCNPSSDAILYEFAS